MNYRFLIYINHSYGLPIGLPLQKEINRLGYPVKWFCGMEAPKKHFPENGELIENIQDAVAYEPHIVFAITDTVPDFISGLKVQVFHGFPANKRKGTDQFTIRGFFDLYCTQGPSSTIPFKKQQQKHQNFEVIETGWPKMDPLFPLEPTLNEKPVILISSTFTKQYSLALKEEVVAEIERLSKTGKYQFMAVLHPKLQAETVAKFKSLENENFKFYDTTDLIPLFKKADIMFSDTTSAIIEFLVQRKPVVTFINNMPGPYVIDIDKVQDIETSIDHALTRPKKLMEEIEKFAEFSHPFKDGRSSERVIQASIDLLHTDKSYLKKKPLNLIRRYKIRKQLNYFSLKSYRKAPYLQKKN
ncbi:CDP-glycerol glycerophosphotransferase family protein [Gramella sp. MAR_2010_147]|uniref:CDP-glycerol glycerophosphotransferase family protein n=1 Tax=Gramella sp. MAR_2010_147 TaxID=1250205 RepID=UPI00087D456A|nr:CDP-glycerol glycerophosphotransferase family protein [Gramella sp. MAR_2010_147]SDR66367.1 CDP-Glycerol:Poly(glycerophosphate) glycerophosphotransferase [Gramella sp. MAR_2010_147]